MMLITMLKVGVIIAAVICMAALILQWIKTRRFGRREDPSIPAGGRMTGIAYAFGPGMMPWAKESGSKHLPTWTAGVVLHAAVFFAFTEVGFFMAGLMPPPGPSRVIRIVLALGLLCGLGLLAKRIAKPVLKAISTPDDFIANALVSGLLLLAWCALQWLWVVPLLLLWSIYLLLYIPFGKIRHCFYFFYTRVLFGDFFGRRGVLPHDGTSRP
jgi:hypothetical protein